MAREVFRKTETGAAALRERASLEPRLRTMLILVNGKLSIEELQAQLGTDPRDTLRLLLARGLIERLPLPVAKVDVPLPAEPPAAAPPPPAPAPPPDAPQGPQQAQQLRELQTRALEMLRTYFGPWGDELAEPVLSTRTLEAYRQALGPLQERLAVYQGKKRAVELIAGILPR